MTVFSDTLLCFLGLSQLILAFIRTAPLEWAVELCSVLVFFIPLRPLRMLHSSVKPGHIGIHKHIFPRASENFCYLATQINRAPDGLCFTSAVCQLHLLSERQSYGPRVLPLFSLLYREGLELLFWHQLLNVEQHFLLGDSGHFTKCVYPRLAPDYFYCCLQYMLMLALLKVM